MPEPSSEWSDPLTADLRVIQARYLESIVGPWILEYWNMTCEGQSPRRSDCKFSRATVASRRERRTLGETPSLGGSIREGEDTDAPLGCDSTYSPTGTQCVSRCHRFGRYIPPIETTTSPSQERVSIHLPFHFEEGDAESRHYIPNDFLASCRCRSSCLLGPL